LLALSVVVLLAALIGLIVVVVPARAQLPRYETGPVCLATYDPGANCTANDFGIKEIWVLNLYNGCTQVPTGTFTADLAAVISSAQADRYDVGIFVGLEGESAYDGANCYHGWLYPPVTLTPYYQPLTPTAPVSDAIFFGPWLTHADEPVDDVCGDMAPNTYSVVTMTLTLPCDDNWDEANELPQPDGLVDVHSCVSWRQNHQSLCTNVQEATPGTGAKCGCNAVNMPFAPTAVELASFVAQAQDREVLLIWKTATELDNLGFNLYRADSADGERSQINGRLIPSEMSGNAMGATYTYLDETAAPGQTSYYWLEDVDVNGLSSMHGPAEATTAAPRSLPGRPRPLPVPEFLAVLATLMVWAVIRL
jgi:hypothetical protein